MSTIDKIRLSANTYDIVDSTAIHSLDGYPTVDEMNSAITASSAAVLETVGEAGYQTSAEVQTMIDSSISGKTDETAFTAHTGDSTIHVTTAQTASWNAKVDTADLAGYADAVVYDSGTTTMNFYHGGTGGTVVFSFDASPFIVDGMIDDVRIETVSGATYLVIDFNTASGKEDIYIPLTDIFDPSNYYTKDEIDAELSGKADTTAVTADIEAATSGKADTSAVTAVNDVLTGHTADTTIHVTSADKTTWSGKQDALVNQVNIKSINGTSLLGSGDITVQSLPTVSGTTLVFD